MILYINKTCLKTVEIQETALQNIRVPKGQNSVWLSMIFFFFLKKLHALTLFTINMLTLTAQMKTSSASE